LRTTIARERGIAAYAPGTIRANKATTFRSRNGKRPLPGPPQQTALPPLAQRILLGRSANVAVFLAIAVLLQLFTPFPVLTWLGS